MTLNLQRGENMPWKQEPHTPGPWQEFAESGDYWIAQIVEDGMPGAVVCDSIGMSGGDTDLICAAPDLLAACEGARALIRTIDTANPGGFAVGMMLLALDKAIAKAVQR